MIIGEVTIDKPVVVSIIERHWFGWRWRCIHFWEQTVAIRADARSVDGFGFELQSKETTGRAWRYRTAAAAVRKHVIACARQFNISEAIDISR